MIPFDLLDEAIQGTHFEWIVLVLLLPLVGAAVARTWGRRGVLAAQRALLVLLVDLAYSLLLAFPVHTGAFLVAALPVAGAAVSHEKGTLRGDPLAWLGAALFALPAVSINHLGPYAWAPWWLIVLFGFAVLRGIVEPVAARVQPLWEEWRLQQRVRPPPRRLRPDAPTSGETTPERAETTVK